MLFTSCVKKDLSQYGKVTMHGPNTNKFTFFVSEEYLRSNQNSAPDKANPKLTEAEAKLLIELLEERNYCRNNQDKTIFRITSKQEKIYDMTFAHLIEQNYNARPVTPLMYYGECLSRPLNQKEVARQLIKDTKSSMGLQ